MREPAVAGGVDLLAVAADVVVEAERLERAREVLGRDGAAVLRRGPLGRFAGEEADELEGAVVREVLGARGDLGALGDHLPHEAHEVSHRQPAGACASLPVRRRRALCRRRGDLLVTAALLRWTCMHPTKRSLAASQRASNLQPSR